jgi:hypothetical protein
MYCLLECSIYQYRGVGLIHPLPGEVGGYGRVEGFARASQHWPRRAAFCFVCAGLFLMELLDVWEKSNLKQTTVPPEFSDVCR